MVDSLTRFRKGHNHRSSAEDEWFIPYNKPTHPNPASSSFSIGRSPPPVRQPSHNLLGYFSGPTSPTAGAGERKSFKFPPLPPTPHIDDSPTLGGLRKAPSYGSLQGSNRSGRIPSSTSVPTGLTAPKMLFSPLSREVRASGYTANSGTSQDLPRSRTFSAPTKRHRSNVSDPFDTRPEARHWAAPTVCDRLVLARPSITPHVITPPGSPEENSDIFSTDGRKIMDEGKQRVDERDKWADYIKHRRRSRSFSNEPPRRDAPIIGNARVRADEFQRRNSQTRSRSNSIGSRLRSRLSHSKSSTDLRPSFLHVDSDQSVGVSKSFGFVKRTSSTKTPSTGAHTPTGEVEKDPFHRVEPNPPYRKGHSYTQSSPELFSQPRRAPPGPPHRTLRIQNPPIRRQGVVIIGAEPEPTNWIPRKAPVPLDFSKPLPDLPVEIPTDDEQTHVDFGKAREDEPTSPVKTVDTSASSMTPIITPSPANARTYLAQQHLKNRTKRAFQAPTSRSNSQRLRTSEPISLDGSSNASSASPARRPTALEEAISRSRAASTSTLEHKDSVSRLHVDRPRTMAGDDTPELPRIISTSPSFSPHPPLAYPISTEIRNGYMMPPRIGRTDTELSKISGKSVYTDASEGWGRSGMSTPVSRDLSVEEATPSIDDELSDRFKVSSASMVSHS